MGRQKIFKGEPSRWVNVIMDEDLLEKLEKIRRWIQTEEQWKNVSRSDAVRRAILNFYDKELPVKAAILKERKVYVQADDEPTYGHSLAAEGRLE